MRRIVIVLGIAFLGFIGCKQEKNDNAEVKKEKQITPPYAEISIKEGGVWEDGSRGHKEYMGGTFKNVQYMDVPSEHTDHSWYIRYEGPGWENKDVGYRLYLDWRNAIDIYGKKVDSIVLPFVGQDGFDSYHEMSNWGMDILKAGKSLGIGGYGRYVNGEVVHFENVNATSAGVNNTPQASSVNIDYKGWVTANDTTDLSSKLTIYPEGRHTKVELKTSKVMDSLCTGIVKFDSIPMFNKTGNKWGYIATYGAQTLVNDTDKLGMAIFFELESGTVLDDAYNHLIVFKPSNLITYYLIGAWEQELNGVKNKEEFENYLNGLLNTLETEGKLE